MPEKTDWNDTIRRYGEEMRRLYEQSGRPAPTPTKAPTEETPPPIPTPAPAVEEERAPAAQPDPLPDPPPALLRETPIAPPFGNAANGTAEPDDPFFPPEQAGETDVGILSVRLISARGTIPIVGATVTVFRNTADGARLYYVGETDENGESPEWALPTLDRDLSLEPGVIAPYVNYAVQANAVGFAAVLNESVSVFGGVKTVQRIAMLPLPEPTEAFDDVLLVTRPENPENELNGGAV